MEKYLKPCFSILSGTANKSSFSLFFKIHVVTENRLPKSIVESTKSGAI